MIKLMPPDPAALLTHGGVSYAPDEDGFVHVPADAVSVFKSHGYSDPPPHLEDEPAPADAFSEMNRSALYAWLHDHGEPAPKASNEELRRLCRNAGRNARIAATQDEVVQALANPIPAVSFSLAGGLEIDPPPAEDPQPADPTGQPADDLSA